MTRTLQPHPTPGTATRPVPRVGVLLAAGRSERIRSLTRGGSKALLRLGGLSLVERAIRTLLAAGVESVVVVVGHDAGPVTAAVNRLGIGRVSAVHADRWQRGNGASLAAARGAVAGEELFVLLTADHVFGEGAIDRLLSVGAPAVLVDTDPSPAAWREGTRVRVVGDAAVAFGKHLHEPVIDCGAFLLPPDIFDCQATADAAGDHTLAGAVTELGRTRPLRAVSLPAGCWWQDVDCPQDVGVAASRLRRSLGKPADGPVSRRLNRPLSTRVSMKLAPLRPDPDLVSLAAFGLGLAGGALLAAGRRVPGAVLVHACSVADGVDGELARLQLCSSPQGALLDGVLDRVADAAILAALGRWALGRHDPRTVLPLTVAATTGALLSMATKDRARAVGLPPAPERALGRLLAGRDGRLLLVAIGALLGTPTTALAAITTTSAAALGLRVALLHRNPDQQRGKTLV